MSSQSDTERAALRKEEWELANLPGARARGAGRDLRAGRASPPSWPTTSPGSSPSTTRSPRTRRPSSGSTPIERTNPFHAAWSSMAAFSVGALLPLLAILLPPPSLRLLVTVLAVTAALVLTGVVSSRLGGAPARPAVLRNVGVGLVAMADHVPGRLAVRRLRTAGRRGVRPGRGRRFGHGRRRDRGGRRPRRAGGDGRARGRRPHGGARRPGARAEPRRPGLLVLRRAVPGGLPRAAPDGHQGLARPRLAGLAGHRRGSTAPEDHWPRAWAEAYVHFAAGEKRAWLTAGPAVFPVVGWAERGGGLAERARQLRAALPHHLGHRPRGRRALRAARARGRRARPGDASRSATGSTSSSSTAVP